MSPDGNILAYAADSVGWRIFTIRFKDLRSGKLLADAIDSVTANLVWANDNRTLFYVKQDPVTLRRDRVYLHVLGTAASEDERVYREDDETFSTFVYRTRSDRYVIVGSWHTLATGLHDSQVQYWEPAKWVAKLRAMKTDDNRLLLKTNMEAGHGAASGRYQRYRETAFVYAFLLDLAGLRPAP